MTTLARPAPIRQIEVWVPVPVTVIPGAELLETQGTCILGDNVAEILLPLVNAPGFIGFKTQLTGDLTELLTGPYSHLLFDNVTADGVAEIGIYGKVLGPLINWDRKVYVVGEESGLPEVAFEIPFGAEIWVCSYVTEATVGSLMGSFYTPDPNEPPEV